MDDLPGLVALNLSKTIKTYPAIGWIRANTSADPDLYKQLSELQKENQELKALKLKQDNEEKDAGDTFADFEDKIKVSGAYRWWNKQYNYAVNSTWEVTITWKQIFSLISPYLLEHPIDSNIKSTLSELIYNLVPDRSKAGTATIDANDYQTIKIHLKAIGLIDVKYVRTTGGGMGLFWSLTKVGEILMLQLRSVKKVTTANEN